MVTGSPSISASPVNWHGLLGAVKATFTYGVSNRSQSLEQVRRVEARRGHRQVAPSRLVNHGLEGLEACAWSPVAASSVTTPSPISIRSEVLRSATRETRRAAAIAQCRYGC